MLEMTSSLRNSFFFLFVVCYLSTESLLMCCLCGCICCRNVLSIIVRFAIKSKKITKLELNVVCWRYSVLRETIEIIIYVHIYVFTLIIYSKQYFGSFSTEIYFLYEHYQISVVCCYGIVAHPLWIHCFNFRNISINIFNFIYYFFIFSLLYLFCCFI